MNTLNAYYIAGLLMLAIQLRGGNGKLQGCNSKESCAEDSPCCKREGESSGECCSEKEMACCEEYGCVEPCPSQFDAVPCSAVSIEEETTNSLESQDLEDLTAQKCPNRLKNGVLYRVTRPQESCEVGLIPKDKGANKTPLSHVNCGSRPGYKSQFISFTTLKDITNKYWNKAGAGAHVVKVQLSSLPSNCKTFDLTVPANRARFLKGAVLANRFAAYDCEVLLSCLSPIPCIVLEGPKYAKDQEEL